MFPKAMKAMKVMKATKAAAMKAMKATARKGKAMKAKPTKAMKAKAMKARKAGSYHEGNMRACQICGCYEPFQMMSEESCWNEEHTPCVFVDDSSTNTQGVCSPF